MATSETDKETTAMTKPIYKQRASRENVADNAEKKRIAEDDYVSINADKPEDEITEEEALADLRRMAEMRVVSGDDLISKHKRSGQSMSESWKDPNVKEARVTRHRVWVNVYQGESFDETKRIEGKEFRSTQAAFNHYKLPASKAVRFRLRLKELGNLAFQHDEKLYAFELLSRDGASGHQSEVI